MKNVGERGRNVGVKIDLQRRLSSDQRANFRDSTSTRLVAEENPFGRGKIGRVGRTVASAGADLSARIPAELSRRSAADLFDSLRFSFVQSVENVGRSARSNVDAGRRDRLPMDRSSARVVRRATTTIDDFPPNSIGSAPKEFINS